MASTLKSASKLKLYFLSEDAITVKFGEIISTTILHQLSNFNHQLIKNPFDGFVSSVAAYATLTIYYDPLQVANSKMRGTDGFDKVSSYLNKLVEEEVDLATFSPRKVVIPVYYGGEYGPDLIELANHIQLSIAEVIALHTATTYTVYMIGFVPGFAYLGGMDEKLNAPRKANPRSHVPAGSVGIAGNQTGVYPLDTPGGWQIIGQTPYKMFNPALSEPSLLSAGDEVVFESIDRIKFKNLLNK